MRLLFGVCVLAMWSVAGWILYLYPTDLSVQVLAATGVVAGFHILFFVVKR